jgi:hypothetical protein
MIMNVAILALLASREVHQTEPHRTIFARSGLRNFHKSHAGVIFTWIICACSTSGV